MKKVALITGSSSGIGSEIAVTLAKDGFITIIDHHGNLKGAEQTLEKIKSAGGEAVIIRADVSNETDVKNMINSIVKQYKRIDVVVNNAGVFKFEMLENITKETFDFHFNVNVWGTISVTKEAVKHMKEGSSVVNISSVRSTNPEPSSLLYASSKSALDCITKTLAKELGTKGIRFNAVAPGAVDTEANRTVVAVGGEYEQMMISQTPLGRFGKTDDIAKVISFLVSDKADWITGERISVSGGLL